MQRIALKLSPPLADLIDLTVQLNHDRDMLESDLRARDRPIGLAMAPAMSRQARVQHWLNMVMPAAQRRGHSVERAIRGAGILLVFLFTLLGWGVSAATYYYDGQRPINVVHVLGVFVGTQLVLLAISLIALIPSGHGYVPGWDAITVLLRSLSPGRLIPWIAAEIPQEGRDLVSQWKMELRTHLGIHAVVYKWLAVSWAQTAAVAFNLAAITHFLVLVVFSDLAFAWSTTLRLTPDRLYAIADLLAWPWSHLWVAARPNLDLIASTQYYRMGPGVLPGAGFGRESVTVVGGWWPFLLGCMIVYGLMPRLLFFVFARGCFARAIQSDFASMPGLERLFDRLESNWIQTQASEAELPQSISGGGGVPTPELAPPTKLQTKSLCAVSGGNGVLEPELAPPLKLRTNSPCAVAAINWGGMSFTPDQVKDWLGSSNTADSIEIIPAGGPDIKADDQSVVRACRILHAGGRVIVLVKAWEPPLKEFDDFLQKLRMGSGERIEIQILPIGIAPTRDFRAPDSDQIEEWRRAAREICDPWISVFDMEV